MTTFEHAVSLVQAMASSFLKGNVSSSDRKISEIAPKGKSASLQDSRLPVVCVLDRESPPPPPHWMSYVSRTTTSIPPRSPIPFGARCIARYVSFKTRQRNSRFSCSTVLFMYAHHYGLVEQKKHTEKVTERQERREVVQTEKRTHGRAQKKEFVTSWS